MQFFVFVFDLCNSYLAFVFLFVEDACVLKGLRCSFRIRLECGPAVVFRICICICFYLYFWESEFVFVGMCIGICWNVQSCSLGGGQQDFSLVNDFDICICICWNGHLYLLECVFAFVGMWSSCSSGSGH